MVKVLDFGLAKALEPVWSGSAGPSASTITSPAMTGIGTILGTAAYMSPEQALGKPVDRRADIWAFGCVLYEMLTGMMAFRGEVVTETLAAVIRADPDWSLLPAAMAQHIRVFCSAACRRTPASGFKPSVMHASRSKKSSRVHRNHPRRGRLAGGSGSHRAWRGR
jgi:serine/threonine protein kinase